MLLGVALSVLPACSGGGGEVTIYSGRGQELVGPILDRFAAETGVSIAVRYGDSAELALLIAEEGDRSPADVFFSQSPGTVGFLGTRELLATLPDPTLDRVDARFRSGSGAWVGVTGRQRVLVYNTELVQEADLPDSVLQLTQPRYAGRVAVAPENASFQDFVSAMRQVVGEEETLAWLTALADGGAPTYDNNTAIVDAVARGEVPMGLVNHYYNERFIREDPSAPTLNHRFEAGDIGGLVIEASVAILRTADDPAAAQRFVDYLLSADAQTYFSTETFEYPLASGVAPNADLPPLDPASLPDVDVDALGAELDATTDLIRRSGLDD